jgi:poly(A) polymerase
MTSPEALASDPLRVVRAYRFAATLGFRVDRKTRRCCRELAGLVPSVHAERLGVEVLSALAGEYYPPALRALAADGILVALISEFARTAGVEQGGAHDFDVAEHSLVAAVRLAEIMRRPARFFPHHAARIAAYLADEQRRSGLVLATLLHDLGKPERRVWAGRRWRFYVHEERGAELAGKATLRLCLPKRVRRQVRDLVRSHMRLLPFMQTDEPTPRARRRFMRDLAPHGIGAVLLALADRRALRVSPRSDDDPAVLSRLTLLLAAGEDNPTVRRHDLPITGDDLLRLGLTPGPQFREILDAIEYQWVAGAIATRADALAWVKSRYVRSGKRGQ